MYASSVAKSCSTLFESMDCNPAGSVHGILQARILERIAICYSRGSSRPRDQTHVSCAPTLTGRFFTTTPPGHLGNPLCLAVGLKKDYLLDNSRGNHDSIILMTNQVVRFAPVAWSLLTPAMWERSSKLGHSPPAYVSSSPAFPSSSCAGLWPECHMLR